MKAAPGKRRMHAPSAVLVCQFARWAMSWPDAARDVATIMTTFRVSRSTAHRWRKAWKESQRRGLPCGHTVEADLAALNRDVLNDARKRVARRRRSVLPPSELTAEQQLARDESGDDVVDYLRATCGAGRHG